MLIRWRDLETCFFASGLGRVCARTFRGCGLFCDSKPNGVPPAAVAFVRVRLRLKLKINRKAGYFRKPLGDSDRQQQPARVLLPRVSGVREECRKLCIGQDVANVHVAPVWTLYRRSDQIAAESAKCFAKLIARRLKREDRRSAHVVRFDPPPGGVRNRAWLWVLECHSRESTSTNRSRPLSKRQAA